MTELVIEPEDKYQDSKQSINVSLCLFSAICTVLRDVLCALVHNTHTIFGGQICRKSHVPIHNTR